MSHSSPLVALRSRMQLSPDEFAAWLGLSPHTVDLVERGRLRRPRVIWEALRRRGLDGDHMSLRYQLWLRLGDREQPQRLSTRNEQVG